MDSVPMECVQFSDCERVNLSCVQGRCVIPGHHDICSKHIVSTPMNKTRTDVFSVGCQFGLTCNGNSGRCLTSAEDRAKLSKKIFNSVLDCKPYEYYSSRSACEPRKGLGQACEKDSCQDGLACSEVEKVCVRKCLHGSSNDRFLCAAGEVCVKLDMNSNDPIIKKSPVGYCLPSSKLSKVAENSNNTTNDTKNTNNTTNSSNNAEQNPIAVIGVMAFVFFIVLGAFLFSKKKSRTVVYTNPTGPTYVAGPGGGPTYVAGPGGSTVIYTNQPPLYSPR